MDSKNVKKVRSGYRKKRRFRGNQFTDRKSNSIKPAEDVIEDLAIRPTICTTGSLDESTVSESRSASAKKLTPILNMANRTQTGKPYESKPSGFRLFDMQIFCDITSLLPCPECFCAELSLYEVNNKRYGNASFLKLKCNNCDWKYVFYTSRKAGRAFEVNRRIVYAFRAIGKGRSGATKFCGLMNMPPPLQSKAYKVQELHLNSAASKVAKESMTQAAAEIHFAVGAETLAEAPISADGTWQKRGHSSLHGITNIISMETGKVLDTEILTQFCKQCTLHENSVKLSLSYDIWRAEHSSKCTANFKGSSGAMEPAGIEAMFKRSVEKHKLLYTSLYCDGDSKSYDKVKEIYKAKYGKEVKRLQCVGHVQKRLGTALRRLKKEVKGIGGKGKLTNELVDKLQNYYGIAIRSNAGDIKKMKKAINASLFHCVATANTPHMHVHCPDGKESWCRFKKDVAANTKTYRPSKGIPLSVLKEVKPVYARLSEDRLLEQCLHGKTQNQNESLNAMIWDRAPKETFVGPKIIETAAYDAIANFNIGADAAIRILKELGVDPGEHMEAACSKTDTSRLKVADHQEKSIVKQRRKYLRGRKKRKIDSLDHQEGLQYGAGEFAS